MQPTESAGCGRVPRRAYSSSTLSIMPGISTNQPTLSSRSPRSQSTPTSRPSITITLPPPMRVTSMLSAEAMWNIGGQAMKVAPRRTPRSMVLTAPRATSARWLTSAALGLPVVPLVYRM